MAVASATGGFFPLLFLTLVPQIRRSFGHRQAFSVRIQCTVAWIGRKSGTLLLLDGQGGLLHFQGGDTASALNRHATVPAVVGIRLDDFSAATAFHIRHRDVDLLHWPERFLLLQFATRRPWRCLFDRGLFNQALGILGLGRAQRQRFHLICRSLFHGLHLRLCPSHCRCCRCCRCSGGHGHHGVREGRLFDHGLHQGPSWRHWRLRSRSDRRRRGSWTGRRGLGRQGRHAEAWFLFLAHLLSARRARLRPSQLGHSLLRGVCQLLGLPRLLQRCLGCLQSQFLRRFTQDRIEVLLFLGIHTGAQVLRPHEGHPSIEAQHAFHGTALCCAANRCGVLGIANPRQEAGKADGALRVLASFSLVLERMIIQELHQVNITLGLFAARPGARISLSEQRLQIRPTDTSVAV
mmetsp:Transcript_49323/g.78576  ORF Transcript_49323/g.78576 Transcript_49323/m.78576 type:complete len:407 (-) Transcript_49323:433-1653(-)